MKTKSLQTLNGEEPALDVRGITKQLAALRVKGNGWRSRSLAGKKNVWRGI